MFAPKIAKPQLAADRTRNQAAQRPPPKDPAAREKPRGGGKNFCSVPARSPLPDVAQPQSSATREATAVVNDVLGSSSEPLAIPTRKFFESRFGHDFGAVRIHSDSVAAAAARSLGAAAFTVGSDITFAAGRYQPHSGAGQRLLAHELTHVVQQRGGGTVPGGAAVIASSGPAEREAAEVAAAMPSPRAPSVAAPRSIQRYEAGEHAQFGETGTELQSLINAPASIYVVKAGGESLGAVAATFKVPQKDLLARNKSKIKQLPVPGKSKPGEYPKTVAGFAAGQKIEIPQVLNQAMRDALTVNELSFKARTGEGAESRASVTYGEGIAMGGDLFGDPSQMDATPKSKIEKLQALIQGEKTSSKWKKFVATAEWETATDKRFAELALHNEAHFAPSNASLVNPGSAAGAANHKHEWERYHTAALVASQKGDKDKALQLNSFADHFLTDAFSAGHLINKLDVMKKFTDSITIKGPGPMNKNSELSDESVKFFDKVAGQAFVGPVEKLFSQYKSVERTYWIRWEINSADRFSKLLQGIYKERPDIVGGAVVKAVHDDLNMKPGGISVENQKGDKWPLSGDKTLNAETLAIGRKAVAQSQYNVLSLFNSNVPPNLATLFKAVWDFVPHPTIAGTAVVKAAVNVGTDPKQTALASSLVAMITSDYKTILDKLVQLGKLMKA